MKKYINVFLLVIFLLCQFGCRKDIENNNSQEAELPYSIIKETFQDIDDETQINIIINYPRLAGIDNELVNTINMSLEKAALEPYNEILNYYDGEIDDTEWNIDYSVMFLSNNVISVKFEGNAFKFGNAHGTNFIYSVNIDLDSGSIIFLYDIFTDSINDKLSHEIFTSVHVDTTDSDKQVIDEIIKSYGNLFETNHDNFYFAESGFVIIVSTNGFWEFISSYEDLEDCMVDTSLWEGILSR